MLVRQSDLRKPTDAAFAFRLRPAGGWTPGVPAIGTRSDIRDIGREALADGEAARFEANVLRWSGPEDALGEAGEQPYAARQVTFEEAPWRARLTMQELESVLRGTTLVMRQPSGQTDYVMRDHHMIDVALYHYRTTGDLPRALFHADRHSDYCKDSFLDTRVPEQAATWWKLFEGLKRPVTGLPVLTEEQVVFATAKAEHRSWMSGRALEGPVVVPWFIDRAELAWPCALEHPRLAEVDWVSVDLDFFQPSPQLALSRGLVRDARFRGLLAGARVRTFVLSPQFTNGGDRLPTWTIEGRLHSSLRLLNLFRDLPAARIRTL